MPVVIFLHHHFEQLDWNYHCDFAQSRLPLMPTLFSSFLEAHPSTLLRDTRPCLIGQAFAIGEDARMILVPADQLPDILFSQHWAWLLDTHGQITSTTF